MAAGNDVPKARPRWFFHFVCLLAAGLFGYADSWPSGDFVLGLLALGIGFGLLVLWAVLLVVSLAERRRWSWWYAIVPAMTVITIGVGSARLPLILRFAMSEDSFTEAVHRHTTFTDVRWVGLYQVARVQRLPDGTVLFYDTKGSFLGEAGFAYSDDGPPNSRGGEVRPSYRHLTGPWYTFTRSDF